MPEIVLYRSFLLPLVISMMACPSIAPSAMADDTENQLTIIVPLGEGGALDKLARRAAKFLPNSGGFEVTVENWVIKGERDGYQEFLGLPTDGKSILAWFEPAAASYSPGVDFDDLSIINVQEVEPPILAARKTAGWTTLAELVAAARQNPGAIRVGAGKAGGNLLILARQFKELGIDISEVDYASGGKARKGLLRGEIELTIGSLKALRKMGDSVVPLAVMSPRRLRLWKEVPTIKEALGSEDADAIFGASYRFFAVHRDFETNNPDGFATVVEAFRQMTQDDPLFEEEVKKAGGGRQWFGPVDSTALIARAHSYYLEMRQVHEAELLLSK